MEMQKIIGIIDEVAAIKSEIGRAKAVAEVFEDKFVSPEGEMSVLEVKNQHETYTDLFYVLFDLIARAQAAAGSLLRDMEESRSED